MNTLSLVSIGLTHPYRPDRASTGHFLSALKPIRLKIEEKEVIVRVSLLVDCPEQLQNHYQGCSKEALIFWTMDGKHHGRSLESIKESLTNSED